ncbi:MAG: hypothetical protein COA78_31105 [Blastopirellula sp.]|nr:MAG: hypothetical protein COA78_31105 [Blastopirellula sp.]
MLKVLFMEKEANMKILIMSLLMLSLSLLTACGGSGSSGDDSPGEIDPSIGDPNEGPKDDPKEETSDLDSLPLTLTEEVNENQLIALTIPEYKDTNSYDFTGADGDNIELSAEDGKVVFKVEADYETQPSYNFIMTVTNAAEQTKDIDVTINIIDLPDNLNTLPPTITKIVNENSRFALAIPEYKATNSYEISGVDGDSFELWLERKEVIFISAPDYEVKDEYSFVMTVTNEIEQTKAIDVTIAIKDISNDFIFEVIEASGGMSNVLNVQFNVEILFSDLFVSGVEQGFYDTWDFSIKSMAGEQLIVESGDSPFERKVYDSATDSLPHRVVISPTVNMPDGLPNLMFEVESGNIKINIIQWGDNPWKGLEGMNLPSNEETSALSIRFTDDIDTPNLSNANSTMFTLVNSEMSNSLSYWDVSNITNMAGFFYLAKGEADLSKWVVSTVKTMAVMFGAAKDFDNDISAWDTSSVEMMIGMFYGAESFDQNIRTDWDVTNVTSCKNFKTGALLLTEAHTPEFENCEL